MSNDTKTSVRGGPRPPSGGAAPNPSAGPKPPPGGRVERPGEPPIYDLPPDFEAREGDVLVVSYPEVTIPLRQYASAKVGGLIYTRKLREGESVAEQFEKVYAFLTKRAENDAREKVKRYAMELRPVPAQTQGPTAGGGGSDGSGY